METGNKNCNRTCSLTQVKEDWAHQIFTLLYYKMWEIYCDPLYDTDRGDIDFGT